MTEFGSGGAKIQLTISVRVRVRVRSTLRSEAVKGIVWGG